MKIDREKIIKTFEDYTTNYNSEDSKIKLKIEHTYHVANLCERIGRSIGLDEHSIELVWLMGILHDVGRFEQVRKYGTFDDSKSVDHAMLSADILFSDGMIDEFTSALSEDEAVLIEKVIRQHNRFRLAEDLSEREIMFCNILRDADKIDILRVNVETPLTEIYNVSAEALENDGITDKVLEQVVQKSAVFRPNKKTSVDNVVGHISLVFELVFEESRRIVREQGYLLKLLDFKTKNEKTREGFAKLREIMSDYL